MNKILSFFFLFFLISCQKNKKPDYIFFGGQIINPSSSYVTLYKDNQRIDSLKLDGSFKFYKKYDSLDLGVYKIEHIPEYNLVFLEKGDSLWVRINASAFDESIFYSGKGASKNNFMMALQLFFENENKFLSSKYSNDSKSFNSIIDSLLIEKKSKWILMDSLIELSPIAQKITQAAYIYPYATKRERYALLRGTNWNKKEDSVFFQYRKYLNYGENDLAFFDPYIMYLMNYINERALDVSESFFLNKGRTKFNIKRLEIIENEITGSVLKNNLARAVAYEEILNYENHKEHDRFLQYYFTVNSSKSHLNEVLTLHQGIRQMSQNKILPRVSLQNHKLDTIISNNIFKSPTVIYFWSQTQMNHFRSTIQKVKKLELEFPNYDFIGISIQPYNEIVSQVHRMMQIDQSKQYAFLNFEKASKKWVLRLLNKAIIVNKNGVIIDGFANFSSSNFSKKLR